MVGRKLEIEILRQAYTSAKPELAAVLERNMHSIGLVDQALVMDDLF
jgi:hypothetical protein